jgi:formate-nitrite transporter family protein
MNGAALESIDHADHESAGELTQSEKRVARERTALRAAMIHEAIRAEGEGELKRPVGALTWSGLAGGLSMSFSLVATGLLQGHLPASLWRPLITNLGYSVGFLATILGRQQLYTENTLTVILPLFTRRDMRTLFQVIRLWSIVLLTNLLGGYAFALTLSRTAVFSPETVAAFHDIGAHAISGGWATMFARAILAGWLIATMVWMLPAADSSGPAIIVVMTYMVSLGGLPHVIAGSTEAFYQVATHALPWSSFLGAFLVPTLIGNTIGGVLLVALFNHAQVVTEANER